MMPFSKNLQNGLKTKICHPSGDEKCHTLCKPVPEISVNVSASVKKKLPPRYLLKIRINKTITAPIRRKEFIPPTLQYKLYYEKGKDFYKA
jgi:hypothetical protein